MSDEILKSDDAPATDAIRMEDQLSSVAIGQYYWHEDDDNDIRDGSTGIIKDDYKEGERKLWCVIHIASNHIEVSRPSDYGTSHRQVHFDTFLNEFIYEPNYVEILQRQAAEIQSQINEKMGDMIEEGRNLCLLRKTGIEEGEEKSTLPAPVVIDPKKYKAELVEFKTDLPQKHKEIDELSEDLSGVYAMMVMGQKANLEKVKKALNVVDDKIFTVELYCGLLEEAHLIRDGEPALSSEKLTIRQQLLFMDEEALLNYKHGGMDFGDIKQFDEWCAQDENINRVLPEQRGIVAFRVRRNAKDWKGELDAWACASWDKANKKTYLLIRNGEKIYRIETDIDFSPRLIPFRDEIDNALMEEKTRQIPYKKDDPRYKEDWPWNYDEETYYEVVTPDDFSYDDYVEKADNAIKHYNRMIILIQGLLDRSIVFAPHPPIKMTDSASVAKHVVLKRTEEDGLLPHETIDWKEWLTEKNKSVKIGSWIYSGAKDEKQRGWSVNSRPLYIQVTKIKRDKSEIRVSWPMGEMWNRYDGYYQSTKMCHLWIPFDKFINIEAYEIGDYKQFLCDYRQKGRYLEWAPYLLRAEDWKREQIMGNKDVYELMVAEGRMPKIIKKLIIVEETIDQDW